METHASDNAAFVRDLELVTPRMRRNDQAILCAEVRRLARELHASDTMPQGTLAERCGASRWREGTIDTAVRAGVRHGTIRRMPGYLAAGGQTHLRDAADGPQAASTPGGRSPLSSKSSRNDSAAQEPASPRTERVRSRVAPDGTSEAAPLILMLLAIALPIGLVVLAARGGGIPLLSLAIATMLAACTVIALLLRRLTNNAVGTDKRPRRPRRSI
jgi:hypothetical protein